MDSTGGLQPHPEVDARGRSMYKKAMLPPDAIAPDQIVLLYDGT